MNIKRNIIFALSLSAFMPQREKKFFSWCRDRIYALSREEGREGVRNRNP